MSSSTLSRFSLLFRLAQQSIQNREAVRVRKPATPIFVTPSYDFPSVPSQLKISIFRFFCSCIIQASCLFLGTGSLRSEKPKAPLLLKRTEFVIIAVGLQAKYLLQVTLTILLIIYNKSNQHQKSTQKYHNQSVLLLLAARIQKGGNIILCLFLIKSIQNHHMPPKKKDQKQDQQILWGRPANTLRMGIVGLPNVGKSTTYNVLSNLNVPAENYPFCTIEPNKAVVPVPDERFKKLCDMYHPKSEVAAVLQVVDIAGIVRGASKGEGLGNHFLSNIRDVDGIYHVVRAFEDEEITHTENSVDPIRDMDIINSELVLKDLEYVTNRLEDLEKVIKRTNPKEAREEKEVLVKAQEILQKNKWVRHGEWSNAEIALLNTHRFITAKSVVYLVNLSKADFQTKKNKWLKKIKEFIDANVPGEIIPYSAEYERAELDNKDEKKRTMIPKIIKAGYNALDLIYYFTSGADEVRCWTIRKLTKAPQAAGVIHTDFEKGFICAEVMKYDDLMALGSENACKAEGKYVQKGKEYVVEDGDIIFFRFNVGKGK